MVANEIGLCTIKVLGPSSMVAEWAWAWPSPWRSYCCWIDMLWLAAPAMWHLCLVQEKLLCQSLMIALQASALTWEARKTLSVVVASCGALPKPLG
jgi:hypothetical protein